MKKKLILIFIIHSLLIVATLFPYKYYWFQGEPDLNTLFIGTQATTGTNYYIRKDREKTSDFLKDNYNVRCNAHDIILEGDIPDYFYEMGLQDTHFIIHGEFTDLKKDKALTCNIPVFRVDKWKLMTWIPIMWTLDNNIVWLNLTKIIVLFLWGVYLLWILWGCIIIFRKKIIVRKE